MEMRTIKEKGFLILGLLSVVLGSVGVILPVLPTTPFLLLAGWFFTRSSPRFKSWLESTRLYERYVGEFKRQGGISRRKKVHILMTTYLVMGLSMLLMPLRGVQIFVGVCGLVFGYFLLFRVEEV
ncbi:YbaN family protein [Aerococcus viridans]|uniref:DUF454 domain-containing protein n=2 Tax=Aerococcus viridans TaxID=1377 RepID=A0AAU8U3A8_9LACT|nr:YbaN family protein [Aerococcus viridans]AMC00328.1 hypothetical protein AWM76_01425 [Aerococcus viridans]EFG49881.1 hypothetical protein HMPREF0061_0807 [Aerococcus viridans ATCC 11563 = CCUG 4311]MEC1386767.1 YbaN family protein [Aerococcus viridans]SUU09370.1 Inner membrane protein ybaN [Aerococcus viridans]